MRRTLRLLADIKPAAARYLEAGQPTGLAGLTTHGSPRSTLMYLYSRTLERLQELPESSVYRRSAEATTRHRLSIVEAAVPPGHAEWHERALEIMREYPDKFKEANVNGVLTKIGDATFLDRQEKPEYDQRLLEWDGEIDEGANTEGLRSAEDKAADHEALLSREPLTEEKVEWEPEPQLTAAQYVFLFFSFFI